ncbi:NUDIX hydrolase [Streptomyces clavuligerus]|nr:NUDIX domain-containing protein [Streptomyces clavuligerus]ANW22375.1 NUDIX hydrolase [Streptomyces clavuligerus]AXU17279.1 NUDIX domain-containing protein [Streptomyces clavuligerus]EDY47506.1 MutT/NUDIX-family protein [Streptomyces clavuligerus]MBY6307076.1 NUDIX domain-containing protein [Streptomyces clavuligerus]QCS10348.1 NUDIX domain-containing protein [Streptomyces clavuligerus]
MTTPEFILRLREFIGHDPLWLSGVTAVVLDGERVLLNRRTDTGRWALLHGILEPGEQPAAAVAREVYEETGIVVSPERITSVYTLPPMVCDNGDQAQYLDITFRCRVVSGTAQVNDDESLDVAWFPLDALPELPENDRLLLSKATGDGAEPWFDGLSPATAGQS